MLRQDFKESFGCLIKEAKTIFLEEYFSDHSCIEKKDEAKILNAIRKIQQVLEGM